MRLLHSGLIVNGKRRRPYAEKLDSFSPLGVSSSRDLWDEEIPLEDSSGRRRTEKEKRGRANCGLELEGRQRLNPRQTWQWGMAQVERRGRGGSFYSPLQDHFLGLPGRRRNAREDVSSCPIAENRVFSCFSCNPTKQLKIFKPDIFPQVRIRFVIDTHFRPQVLGKKSSLATAGLFLRTVQTDRLPR